MTFTHQAQLLAGQAGLLLGWRPDDFWRATPDELASALQPFTAMNTATDSPLDRAAMESLWEKNPDG